jgi:cell division protein FtsW
LTALARNDHSLVGQWWWTVDRWTLASLALLVALGTILTMAASPAIADRMGVDQFYFVRRQLFYGGPALLVMIGVSLLSPQWVRRIAVVGLLAGLLLMVVTIFAGAEVNGARRWIRLGAVSLQVSEFVKPTFVVTAAWLLATQRLDPTFPGNLVCVALCAVIAGLLMLQPDFSMAVLVGTVWFAQCFLAGLHLRWVALLAMVGISAAAMAYIFVPHVTDRVDRFLDPASGDSYQVDTALEAFTNGGLLGRGPGEGVVKETLPDAHSDFVFAVAGEEFGLLLCLALLALFAFVVLRGFGRLHHQRDLFVMLAVGGLLIQFGLQALLHMGVTLALIPPTGMTLPFVSYGGSSTVAVALGMGMVLALTRRRPGYGGGS